MKRFLIYSFVALYMFSSTELHQLIKLPVLIKHFQEHQKEDTTLSFWSFLEIHYAHGIVLDDDYEKDMKLPFKTHDSASHINVPVYAESIAMTIVLFRSDDKYTAKSDINYTNPFIENPELSAIWQPPKFMA